MTSQVKVDDLEPNIRLPSVVRSQSAQGLASCVSSPILKIPLPPRSWFTDVSNESSEEDAGDERENDMKILEKNKVRARYRHQTRAFTTVPIGIFWDIENCQVPRGCSAIDVVSAIRTKFLAGRRESDFVVVCDVRKETAHRLQELNDAQVSLIHVCGTQKNAADEKLRQCMRRFGEIHSAPAALLLISGDINFASDLSDFRHRKGLEVILVHKQNTSNALIACASSHYCYNELTSQLPRNYSKVSSNEGDDEPACMVEVLNLPTEQPPMRVARRLKRLADNCGGRVFHIAATVAIMKFPTPDHAARAAKRMDSEDVFGHKIVTRYSPNGCQSSVQGYSSDEGYSTGSVATAAREREGIINQQQVSFGSGLVQSSAAQQEWALALQQLPAPTPPPLEFCPPPAPKPRRIRGTHGSNMNQSGCSSSNSGNGDRETSHSRAVSPWNSSASYSSEGDGESSTEVSVSNLPSLDLPTLHDMLKELFSQHVTVVSVTVWMATEGPLATVVLRSEWDARLAIARIHKRRFDNKWAHSGKRLELSFGKPSPVPNVDMLRARLRAILLDQPYYTMPLLRLRDAYANRHCSALTTADISRVKDTVVILEGVGRYVKLIDFTPVSVKEMEEAPWKCHIHATLNSCPEDGSRVLQPVFIELSVLATNTLTLLGNHGGIVPLLSFVECYETFFPALPRDVANGVPLELLLRSVSEVEVRESPSRHVTWRTSANPAHNSAPAPTPRTAPSLEPMLALLERELSDLLRSSPRCTIAFSKLIPAFHHHFGRQCRVADYGFTKLPDLLAALSNAIVVLGSGSSRLITLSAASQSRRWTSDMLKMLKAQPGRIIHPKDIPQLYQTTFNTAFSPADYGVCTLDELMLKLNLQTLTRAPDGSVSLPRRAPTPEERARTAQFAAQAIELLCTTPNLRMEFSKFVPAYHAHFGRQLRVAHYGCVKLAELFELIPEAVTVTPAEGGERLVKLASGPAVAVMNQRMERLAPVPLSHFPVAYAAQYGGALDGLNGGGSARGGTGLNRAPDAPGAVAVSSALMACAVLSADRSVARGSTEDYFANSYRRKCGLEPDLRRLVAAGVVTCIDRRVRVTAMWRAVWRIAQILSDAPEPISALQILMEYTKRYEPTFPSAELGFASLYELVRSFPSVFVEEAGGGAGAGTRWRMASGVMVPRQTHLTPQLNYSIHDTPPGQKGSRVFESPKNRMWCSPPASAVPMPSALLPHDNKRRIRLAAQFDGI